MKTSHIATRTGQRDLRERTVAFAQDTRAFVRKVPKTIDSLGNCRRFIRSSGEVGSAYLDADRASIRKQFVQHISDCCRQIRQAQYWLRLQDKNLDSAGQQQRQHLLQEGAEPEKHFGSILKKARTKPRSDKASP